MLTALVSILGTLVAVALGAVLTTRFTYRREHDQWLRDVKLIRYENVLVTLTTLLHKSDRFNSYYNPVEHEKLNDRAFDEIIKMRISAPVGIFNKAVEATSGLQESMELKDDEYALARSRVADTLGLLNVAMAEDIYSMRNFVWSDDARWWQRIFKKR